MEEVGRGCGWLVRLSVLVAMTAGGGSCAPREPSMAERLDLPTAGPTSMARVADGYELVNRQVRVVIDEARGIPAYWGSVDGNHNLLTDEGLEIELVNLATAKPRGYVEKRDDQTWQYIGDDAPTGLHWRRIYCLEGLSLLATFIVQNNTDHPIDTTMRLRVDFAELGGRRVQRADLFMMQSRLGMVSVRGFREHRFDGYFDFPPGTLISDRFQLQPGERYSFTTEWRIDVTFGAQ